jgi:hypothetical protein
VLRDVSKVETARFVCTHMRRTGAARQTKGKREHGDGAKANKSTRKSSFSDNEKRAFRSKNIT